MIFSSFHFCLNFSCCNPQCQWQCQTVALFFFFLLSAFLINIFNQSFILPAKFLCGEVNILVGERGKVKLTSPSIIYYVPVEELAKAGIFIDSILVH